MASVPVLSVVGATNKPANEPTHVNNNNVFPIFQRKRLFGEFLMGKNALPALSESSLKSIAEGIPDYRSILKDVRFHTKTITKGMTIKRYELNNMSEALVKAHPGLADVDDPEMKRYVGCF